MKPDAWKTCSHVWRSFFGPCLRCIKCGAQTMASMDPKESKAILPPPSESKVPL